MKQILTILVAVSLFTPHLAKMMAYVDCTFVAITYNNPELCDCNRIIDNDLLPSGPDLPDKQKSLSLKADWKYTEAGSFRIQTPGFTRTEKLVFHYQAFLLQGCSNTPFHPPRC